MSIHSRANQYLGVNAHLNSRLQSEFDAWGEFHSHHITFLNLGLNEVLPDNYVVSAERGLQIIEFHPDTGERVNVQRRRPDLAIYDRDPARVNADRALGVVTAPTLTLSALDSVDNPELHRRALVIRKLLKGGEFGEVVTWIEVLSPANKPHGTGYGQYLEKRLGVLHSGVALVEIDYLHQTPSVFPRLPVYPDKEPGAYPYTVIVTEPRPSLEEGYAYVYGFGVDDPMPILAIPLTDEETVAFNLGATYNRMFSSFPAFVLRADYGQEPDHMESYTDADQSRIRARMAAVKHAVEQGVDLAEGPFPTDT